MAGTAEYEYENEYEEQQERYVAKGRALGGAV
jgi:hypothetical protein